MLRIRFCDDCTIFSGGILSLRSTSSVRMKAFTNRLLMLNWPSGYGVIGYLFPTSGFESKLYFNSTHHRKHEADIAILPQGCLLGQSGNTCGLRPLWLGGYLWKLFTQPCARKCDLEATTFLFSENFPNNNIIFHLTLTEPTWNLSLSQNIPVNF